MALEGLYRKGLCKRRNPAGVPLIVTIAVVAGIVAISIMVVALIVAISLVTVSVWIIWVVVGTARVIWQKWIVWFARWR